MDLPSRCAQPKVHGISTYTVLGFAGYGIANVLGIALAEAWGLDFVDRLVIFFAPPIAFIVVVFSARLILGEERIVFYQAAITGVGTVLLAAWLGGAHVLRCLDIAVVGIGTFLVLGRLGCFSVACCHGVPSRVGVVYGPSHVKVGFWWRWSGRRLWPVQLVEAATSAILVIAALAAGWNQPGTATLVYAVGYGTTRFVLELKRGDPARPQVVGLTEAQLSSIFILVACAIWRPATITIAAASTMSMAAVWIWQRRTSRELFIAPHLHELDRLCTSLEHAAEGTRVESTLGVMISRFVLPDGRKDWVMSSTHPVWAEPAASRIASLLWQECQVVIGRTAGVIHVITR